MRFIAVTSFAAALLLSFGVTSGARATIFTYDLTYGSSTPLVTLDPFNVGGNNGRLRLFGETSGAAPLTINDFHDGDTVTINFTFGGGGLTLQDTGSPFLGNVEALAGLAFTVNGWTPPGGTIDPGDPLVYTADIHSTLSVTGYSGDLTSSFIDTGTMYAVPSLTASLEIQFVANITNSSVALTSFTISRTFSNFIIYNEATNDPYPDFTAAVANIAVLDDSSVPAPGALALLGLGLIGFGGLRRKLKAA